MSNKLPQGWVECKLEDILIKLCNGTSKKQNKNANGVPVTRIETISDGTINFNKVGYISNISKEDIETYKLLNGDILFSNINSDFHLGKTAIYKGTEVLLHGMNLLLLRFDLSLVIPNFINYYLNYCRFTGKFIKIAQHAVNQSSINQTKLKNFPVSFPPLNEQKRIVEKIEEEFGKIDEGVEKLKLAQEQIKQYRQSVLKSAFDGKLYKTTEWKEKTLGQVIFPRRERITPNNNNGEMPFIGMDCIKPNSLTIHEQYKLKDTKSVSFVFYENDVLYGRMRSYLNKVWQATFAGAASAEFIIFPENENIEAGFLKYLLHQQNFVKYATRNASGDRPRVKFESDLAGYKFICPSKDEQKQIVAEIEKRFEVANEVERVITENLAKAEQLKQSILKKAFEGRLVPQDPTDEPASELLAKIQKERKNSHERI